jgi:NadR type nicotinamide-nucleotide adenylyltransferase
VVARLGRDVTGGVVIGKFLPPHAGHLHLCHEARKRCDRLYVLVCTLSTEPIDGALRAGWMRDELPDCDVIHVARDVPQAPSEHPRFWQIWRALILSALPEPPDVLFSSEAYGWTLGPVIGAKHVAIDPPRTAFPVSGTAVRADPIGQWAYLPRAVRPYFVRRVVLTGPESSGKTTLAARLAARFETVWVPEFARGYLDRVNPTRTIDGICLESDLVPIARGQIASEDALAAEANRVLICDTDPRVTTIYAHHYFGRVAPELDALADRPYALHLLLTPEVPWVADSQRDRPEARGEMFTAFAAAYAAAGARVVPIGGGDYAAREEAAIAAISALLAAPYRDFGGGAGGGAAGGSAAGGAAGGPSEARVQPASKP